MTALNIRLWPETPMYTLHMQVNIKKDVRVSIGCHTEAKKKTKSQPETKLEKLPKNTIDKSITSPNFHSFNARQLLMSKISLYRKVSKYRIKKITRQCQP